MSSAAPPNDELAELASVLGDDNVRTLVRTFLREFATSISQLNGGERKNRHRIAHSMKSNARLVGAYQLSQRMADLEARLAAPEGLDVSAEDLAGIQSDFDLIAPPLKAYAGE